MRLKLSLKKDSKKIWVGFTAIAILLSFSVIPTQEAAAHYVYRSAQLYWSGGDCVTGRSEVSHGSGNGYSRADIEVTRYSGTYHESCGEPFSRPNGYIRERMALMYWTTQWNTCHDTGYLYNGKSASIFTVTRTYSNVCGGRNYDTQSWIHEYNGSWKGGILWSGSHWLPI
ncbi:MAG TPA: hypothetical protein VLG47_07565 [Candidatus Saccharimonadales bacterium]|nr:hypothetical protein [Candidatus Saccharimonadales bacterium]